MTRARVTGALWLGTLAGAGVAVAGAVIGSEPMRIGGACGWLVCAVPTLILMTIDRRRAPR